MSLKLNEKFVLHNNNDEEKDYGEDENNIYPRLLGGGAEEFPLHFPDINHHSIKYIQLYLSEFVKWRNVIIDSKKISFLIDKKGPLGKYSAFSDTLKFNEQNYYDLEKQIKTSVGRYKLFLTNKIDKYGYRVKVYMPIYSLDRKSYLIIKTLWLINSDNVPIFITAYFNPKYLEDAKNEISE